MDDVFFQSSDVQKLSLPHLNHCIAIMYCLFSDGDVRLKVIDITMEPYFFLYVTECMVACHVTMARHKIVMGDVL